MIGFAVNLALFAVDQAVQPVKVVHGFAQDRAENIYRFAHDRAEEVLGMLGHAAEAARSCTVASVQTVQTFAQGSARAILGVIEHATKTVTTWMHYTGTMLGYATHTMDSVVVSYNLFPTSPNIVLGSLYCSAHEVYGMKSDSTGTETVEGKVILEYLLKLWWRTSVEDYRSWSGNRDSFTFTMNTVKNNIRVISAWWLLAKLESTLPKPE